MIERAYTVFKSNTEALERDFELHEAVSEGVYKQLAEHLNKIYPDVTASQAYGLFLDATDGGGGIYGFAVLCKYLNVSKPFEVDEKPEHISAVYFRTPIADNAYTEFTSIFKSIGATYSSDFKSVCEDVYYDRADACILPLESSDDGLIMSFRNMLIKYELKILSVVKVPLGDDRYQTMALLTNGLYDADGNVCELFIPSMSPDEFSEICRSMKHFSAKILRITSVPSKTEGRYDHHVCLSLQSEAVPCLTFFTDAVCPANIFLGQYKNYYSERNAQ